MALFDILVNPMQKLWMERRGMDPDRKNLIILKPLSDGMPLYVKQVIEHMIEHMIDT